MRVGGLFALLFVPLVIVSAQPKPTNHFDVRKPLTPPVAVKGLPYSGELASVATAISPEGTRITTAFVLRTEYRDSQGRTRREQLIPPDEKGALRIVTIDDPVAGFEYVLEPKKKIAHRFRLEPFGPERARSTGSLDSPVSIRTEALDPQVIQGMHATGVRQTTTAHDSSDLGTDRPRRDRVTETWTASDLQILLREHTSTSDSETNTQMTKLRTEEQPANLFQVPSDYRVEDELDDFIIEYPIRGHTSPPEIISRVTAKYTDDARRAGIQGTVLLSTTIDKTGRARDVQVQRSVEPGLDQEAIKAVGLWRFRPGEQDGHPVSVSVNVEVTFSLNQ